MRARLYVAVVVAAAWMAVPAGAGARSNCCFELAVDNQTSYFLDYLQDGFGYDGVYSYQQRWWLRMIVGYSDRGAGKLVQRDGYSLITLIEDSGITRCNDSSRPCVDNREPLPCPGADAPLGGLQSKLQASIYARQAGLTVSRDGLHAAPPDSVYYSIDQLGCNGGHGHPGYGDRAKGWPVTAR